MPGVLMRLEVTSGSVNAPSARASASFLVTQDHAPRGTEAAMVGTRASCQPMPVLRIVAPSCSIQPASVITSSSVEEFGTRSSMERR